VHSLANVKATCQERSAAATERCRSGMALCPMVANCYSFDVIDGFYTASADAQIKADCLEAAPAAKNT